MAAPAQLSLVSGANALGMLIPCLLAGVVADRIPQKTILLAVATTDLASIGLVAALSLTDLTQLWHLVVVSLVFGLATSFYYPAYSAWLPALVPEEDLLAVNGFEGMVRPDDRRRRSDRPWPASSSAPPPAGPLLIAAVLGGSALLALLPRCRAPPVRRATSSVPTTSTRSGRRSTDMREGFVYMVRTPWLLATLVFASLMILLMMGPFEVLVPFLIKDGWAATRATTPMVLAAFGIGGAVGSMAVASFPMPRRYLTLMNLVWGVGCLPLALFGVVDEVWMLVVLALLRRRDVVGADGHLGHAAAAPGAAGHARPGVVARLLRVAAADAGLDGAGRPGGRADRAADDVPRRRSGADGDRRGGDRVGAASRGRAGPPAELRPITVEAASSPVTSRGHVQRQTAGSRVRERMPSLR